MPFQAPPEVLERLAGLLEGASGSITLVERGDTRVVPRHPGFRLVAAMNPATDAGKRELPAPLRNRFTGEGGLRQAEVCPCDPICLACTRVAAQVNLPQPRLSSSCKTCAELWCPEPSAREDLRSLVAGYLAGVTVPLGGGGPDGSGPTPGGGPMTNPVEACVDLYIAAKQEAVSGLNVRSCLSFCPAILLFVFLPFLFCWFR